MSKNNFWVTFNKNYRELRPCTEKLFSVGTYQWKGPFLLKAWGRAASRRRVGLDMSNYVCWFGDLVMCYG